MGFGLRPAGNAGFWGDTTSSLDWCEENYVVTHYIAEFWNSTSNVLYLVGALIGLFSATRIGVGEWRTYWSLLSIAVVGIGSFLFHSTLWFETQMMDELPMIWGSCVFVFANLRVFPEANKNNTTLIISLVAYSVIVTCMYLYLNNPIFHEVCYAVLVSILFLLPPQQIIYLRKNYPQYSGRIQGLWKLYAYGAVSYLTGFMIWGIDNNFCEILRSVRQSVGYPLRVMFEFHLWWHTGTAVGTYASVMMITYLRQLALAREDVILEWIFGVFPFVTSRLDYASVRKLVKDKAH